MKIFILLLGLSLFLISCGSNPASNTAVPKEEKPIIEIVQEKTILALGDSLTAGYNLDIADSFPHQLENLLKKDGFEYKVVNAGVSGDTSKNLLDRIALYDQIKPTLSIVSIGANNGLRKQDIDVMKSDIIATIKHLQEINPNGKIILSGMQMPLNVGAEYATKFQNVYPAIQESTQVELFPFLLQDVATIKELNLSDGIHPNKKGYSIIANNLYNFLEEEELLE